VVVCVCVSARARVCVCVSARAYVCGSDLLQYACLRLNIKDQWVISNKCTAGYLVCPATMLSFCIPQNYGLHTSYISCQRPTNT